MRSCSRGWSRAGGDDSMLMIRFAGFLTTLIHPVAENQSETRKLESARWPMIAIDSPWKMQAADVQATAAAAAAAAADVAAFPRRSWPR